MAQDTITVIKYISPLTKNSHRQKALQTSAARAHAARTYHSRKRSLLGHHHSCNAPESLSPKVKCKKSCKSPVKDENDSSAHRQAVAAIDAISRILDRPEDVALNFTLTQLIEGSYFEYLPLLFANVVPGRMLEAATQSMTLACFARWTGRNDMLLKSRRIHQNALRQMRTAINDPASICTDETLASVMLLAHFELLAEDEPDNVSQALVRHLDGARAILQIRLSRGIKSQVGDQIVLQIWDKITMQSYARHRRLPSKMDDLLPACTNPQDFVGLGGQLHTREVPRRMIHLRASIADKSLTDPIFIINETLEILVGLSTIHDQMIKTYPYSTVRSKPPLPGSFRGIYHVYVHGQAPWRFLTYHCMATVWMRSIVVKQLRTLNPKRSPWSPDEVQELLEVSEREIEKAALKLCACVPQHLHPSFKRNHHQQNYLRFALDQSKMIKPSTLPENATLANKPPQDRTSESSEPPQRISSACSMIWPLYTVGRATKSTELRGYVIDRLRYIASSCRVRLAETAAQSLEKEEPMNEEGMEALFIM